MKGSWLFPAVKQAAAGRSVELLASVGGFDSGVLDGKHHPCPRCGGTDRFRLFPGDAGSVHCNQCLPKGSGDVIASVAWLRGVSQKDAAQLLADAMGLQPPPSQETAASGSKDWEAVAASHAKQLVNRSGERQAFADALGLPAESLDALPFLGVNGWGNARRWTWAELDGAGNVVGVVGRAPNGEKRSEPGSKRGLTVPVGLAERLAATRLLFIVEGASDAIAGFHAGLDCIGRPGVNSGAKLLAAWIAEHAAEARLVVVGERDQKPDGSWPGRDLAIGFARTLAKLTGRTVEFTLPPEGSKDLRAALIAAEGDWPERGEALGYVLAEAAEPVEPSVAGLDSALLEDLEEAVDDPHRLARGLIQSTAIDGVGVRRFWRSTYWTYDGSAYRSVEPEEIAAELTSHAKREFDDDCRSQMAAWLANGAKDDAPQPKKVTRKIVSDALNAFNAESLLGGAVESPSWIGEPLAGWDPRDVLPTRNALVNLKLLSDGRADHLMPPTPRLFTTAGVGYDWTPPSQVKPPVEWLRFLDALWGQSQDCIDTLQEMFGYLLTQDTSLQKIFLFVGPPRSGKGTIGRILRMLLGVGNIVGPSLSSLAGNFGLQPLIGKSVAIIADARLGGRTDAAVVTERLLSISGEDTLTVDRKHKSSVTCVLPTRIVIFTNELPKLSDPSGALVNRYVILRMTETFLGREDVGLADRLTPELPGILHWALEGRERLRSRGRFVMPALGAEMLEDLEDLTSPVGAFVRSECTIGPEERVATSVIYGRYRYWCGRHGKSPRTEEVFGRDLRAALPNLRKERVRNGYERTQTYVGVSSPSAPVATAPAPPGSNGYAPQVYGDPSSSNFQWEG